MLMAIPENKPDGEDDVSSRWGTKEELLLAFAVNRHGTGAWASVASEIQKRSSDPNSAPTAHNCKQKYLDLVRRFLEKNDNESMNDNKSNEDESVPVLEEELRKLRVAELRREVHRYNLNIECLELKMKSMADDRERNPMKEKIDSDLEKEDEKPCPSTVPGVEPIVGEESEKDHMSVNESNSTDLGAEKVRIGENGSEPEEVRGEIGEGPVDLKSESDLKPAVREDSCNGSSNSRKEEPASDSADSSKGDEAEVKESSDVQSSASRSRNEERNDKARRVTTSGDEREHEEDRSRAVKKLSVQSQPFVDFLKALRDQKLGSVFRRRLKSQETSKYHKLILQPIDLETVEKRLKEGWYSGSTAKFFRDLLLIVNNALVFFNKNSSEAHAAIEIRHLISKEMSKSDSSSGKQISLQSLSLTKKEDTDPLQLKPRISGSIIVCRKRSSIAAKSSSGGGGGDKKKGQTEALLAEDEDSKPEEPKITKKRTRDRFSPVSKKSSKIQTNNNNNNSNTESGKHQGKGGGSSSQPHHSGAKKKSQTSVDSKKRGAANFLNRMKQSTSPNKDSLLDALKNTPLTSDSTSSKGGSDLKKNENPRRGEKKEMVTRKSLETRQVKERGSPGKRNVGRPPKRGAAPSPALGKRGRKRAEMEMANSKQPKKRSKKV